MNASRSREPFPSLLGLAWAVLYCRPAAASVGAVVADTSSADEA